MDRNVLITGITGQDGSYLADLFLEETNYDIVGLIRRSSTPNTKRISHLLNDNRVKLIEGDITDFISVSDIINEYKPIQIYNLCAQSHVGTSFNQPNYTWEVNATGTYNVLEAVRRFSPLSKVYQASTSEMFGSIIEEDGFQRETTELSPNSPYAIAKVAAHHNARLYRDAYNLFICSGILFNHESPRRGDNFVTKKVTNYCAKLRASNYSEEIPNLKLGNLYARRDWGHAKDYVRAQKMILEHDTPDDYIISTGISYSVKDMVSYAFDHIGCNWEDWVDIDESLYRPCEVPNLRGDSSKAHEVLGWAPQYTFEQMIAEMIDSEK